MNNNEFCKLKKDSFYISKKYGILFLVEYEENTRAKIKILNTFVPSIYNFALGWEWIFKESFLHESSIEIASKYLNLLYGDNNC